MEKNGPPAVDMLVMGPWNHGGFARGDGDKLGNVTFGSKTGVYYRERIELPFFLYYLKGRGDASLPKAHVFQTGMNQWRKFDTLAACCRQTRDDLSRRQRRDSRGSRPLQAAFDEYLSDPNKPVPYIGALATRVLNSYMTEDQRFAAARPDVLVYKSAVLDRDVERVRPHRGRPASLDHRHRFGFRRRGHRRVPRRRSGLQHAGACAASCRRPPAAAAVSAHGRLSAVGPRRTLPRQIPQELRKPVPFEPGKPDRITFAMPDIAHTFRAGHRIMVQIQSSWFPLTDRNPQKFMEIPKRWGLIS